MAGRLGISSDMQVAPTSRLAGPLRSQDRPWIGRGDRDVARVRGAHTSKTMYAPPALLPDDVVKHGNYSPAIIEDVGSQDLTLISVVRGAFRVIDHPRTWMYQL